ncbi:hypothetical protein Trydic_g194 [Trypoxylus dichotomus]
MDDSNLTGYECELCATIFPTKRDFLGHHLKNDNSQCLVCCNCAMIFESTTELFQHKESHKMEEVIIDQGDIQFNEYTEEVEAVLNIPNDDSAIGSTNELLYILDDSQCVNEVIIEETESNQCRSSVKPDNYSIVQVDHGYMIPSVFKGQLETRKRVKKKDSHSDSDDPDRNNLLVPTKATTSKRVIPTQRVRQLPVRKRHDVPDFSASDYAILNPNDEVDITHYKCLRCEQLFINKFGFFRHVEKGKCYINSCDVCCADFHKNSDFYEHYIVEHTDRAICNFCFRTFMYEKNVKEHMLRHLDQFRHRCEECNKGFYTVREYRNHYKNRHMGIRHRCEECGRSFADEYYFKRHIATHVKKTVDLQG